MKKSIIKISNLESIIEALQNLTLESKYVDLEIWINEQTEKNEKYIFVPKKYKL